MYSNEVMQSKSKPQKQTPETQAQNSTHKDHPRYASLPRTIAAIVGSRARVFYGRLNLFSVNTQKLAFVLAAGRQWWTCPLTHTLIDGALSSMPGLLYYVLFACTLEAFRPSCCSAHGA